MKWITQSKYLPSGDNCGSFSLGTKCITILFPGGKFRAKNKSKKIIPIFVIMSQIQLYFLIKKIILKKTEKKISIIPVKVTFSCRNLPWYIKRRTWWLVIDSFSSAQSKNQYVQLSSKVKIK